MGARAKFIPDAATEGASRAIARRLSLAGWLVSQISRHLHRPEALSLSQVIGAHWLLHHWTPAWSMSGRAAVPGPARRFCRGTAWEALEQIGAMLDLDFVGIDFSVPNDGRLLLFEASATMLVHPEDDPLFSYKNFAVRNIVDAFDRLIARKLARD